MTPLTYRESTIATRDLLQKTLPSHNKAFKIMMVDDLLHESYYMFIPMSSQFYFFYNVVNFYTLIDPGFCPMSVL
jgi:hypothetical protein